MSLTRPVSVFFYTHIFPSYLHLCPPPLLPCPPLPSSRNQRCRWTMTNMTQSRSRSTGLSGRCSVPLSSLLSVPLSHWYDFFLNLLHPPIIFVEHNNNIHTQMYILGGLSYKGQKERTNKQEKVSPSFFRKLSHDGKVRPA